MIYVLPGWKSSPVKISISESVMKKFLITALKITVFFIGWAVLSGVIDIPNDDPALWRFFAELMPLLIILFFTVIFMLIEKKSIRLPVRENFGKGFLTGTLTGLAWIGSSTAILIFSKQLVIIEKNAVPSLWLWTVSAFINVIMQELLVRGYIYQLIKTRYDLPAAVIFTTALFTFLHAGAFEAGVIPVINVITMCLFTDALYESEKTLAAPVMAHAVWNVAGALFSGGVSLADDYPHMLTLSPSQNILLSGGEYKTEASIVVTFINIALTVLFYVRYKKRKNAIT